VCPEPARVAAPGAPVAIVTGAARGMGLACAERLAGDGASVAVIDRDEAAVEAAASLPQGGGGRLGLTADVTVRDEVERAVARVAAELGPPTVLVNNAGILHPTPFLDISDEEWQAVLSVSLTGAFLCSQACLPAMIEAGFGRIVNLSSTAGKSVSTLGGAHYTSAKAGVLGLTRALAYEAAGHGITVNAVCPGLIDTQMAREQCTSAQLAAYAGSFPVGRLGEPREVAALIAFLCGADAAYITGAAVDINGGDLMV
jgi:NAD(P)-dependent dehydrogenase (short-subunit alcohol dehydrogenase family)